MSMQTAENKTAGDAPRPDEIVVIMAISDVGRPHPRVGKGRV
jgi:hypothetical protein